MRLRSGLLLIQSIALIAVVISGCGGPTVRGTESTNDYSARFVDDDGERIASVSVTRGERAPGEDGMTEVGIQVAHRQGTKLDSLEVEFISGLFTPVYVEPPNHWFDGMEYTWRDGVATFRIPKLEDVYAESTATYTFLVPTAALSEQAGGIPLTVRFTLDGTEAMAHFDLTAGPTQEPSE